MLSFFSRYNEPHKARLAALVIALHLFALLFLFLFSSPAKKNSKKHLVVKTIVSSPLKSAEKLSAPPKSASQAQPAQQKKPEPAIKNKPAAAKPAPQKKINEPAKKTAPTPSKKAAPATEKKKPAPVKKAEAKAPAISNDLLQELEESIAKIDQKRDKVVPRKKLDSLKSLEPLSVDAPIGIGMPDDYPSAEGRYQDKLIQFLHGSLNLPDYGEVKLQLTLSQDGSVLKVVVLKTESEKNKRYLEQQLLKMKFPRLEEPYANKSQHTFVLTFCNEI